MGQLEVTEYLKKAATLPIVDVRSPAEFAAGHIPGAHNVPLFDNDERAFVGTMYKQVGRQEAFLKGLDIVGPKMRSFVEQAQSIAPEQKLLLHCWRGGMRSQSVAWLLNTAGMQVATLEGGYKSYRKHGLSLLAQPSNIIVIGGKTGSGKTDILKALTAMGEQAVDLEGLAHHKGSAFGGIGQLEQPTTEHFQNQLFQAWQVLDLSRPIWLEDESFSIGKVQLPHELWEQMKAAKMVTVEVPLADRIQRLVREYGAQEPGALQTAIRRIEKRLGTTRMVQALNDLSVGRIANVAENLLTYYDRSYLRNMDRRPKENTIDIQCYADKPKDNAYKIIDTIKQTQWITY